MPAQFIDDQLSPDTLQALRQGLTWFLSFTSADPVLQQALLDAAAGKGKAWRVFTLLLPDVLKDGRGLQGVSEGGWRVAARSGAQVIAADIYTGNTVERTHPYPLPAGVPRLACIRRGDEISQMLTAMESLSGPVISSQIPAQLFNLDLLLLPGLVTDSLWLRPQNPAAGASYIVPWNTLITGLDAGKLYPEDQFLQVVQTVAEDWVAFGKQEASRVLVYPATSGRYRLP